MSTFNSFINMTTAFLPKDIYHRTISGRRLANRQLMYVSYIFGVVFVGVSFLLAFTMQYHDIWEWITMGFGGGLLSHCFSACSGGGLTAADFSLARW